ncbi:MAG: response regulator transcription factor [Dehalococcoidales bacterium]|nr:response regulator transcription factor [Dehalococcoidales bacterium]
MSEAKAKILLVDDDESLLEILRFNLEKDGYQCLSSTTGAQALEVAHQEKPDLIILDIMLPEISGFEVCRILRKNLNVPIIMLTAKAEEIDKVVGLELGADDYITKPFSLRELQVRIKSLLRRSRNVAPKQSEPPEEGTAAGDLQIDVRKHTVTLDGVTLKLTPKEFDLLHLFISNRGRVLTRDQILDKVWGYDYTGGTRTVDTLILGLRKKIEADPAKPKRLVTVWGVGYRLFP